MPPTMMARNRAGCKRALAATRPSILLIPTNLSDRKKSLRVARSFNPILSSVILEVSALQRNRAGALGLKPDESTGRWTWF